MATRTPPVELFYDPADLDPDAPRLYVLRTDDAWELQDEEGAILSTHPTQRDAIDAGLARSAVEFCEILVRGSTGDLEMRLDQDPDLLRITSRFRERRRQHREAAD
jgi:Uncharacterized protein conserved in bacteria (DUF2188)